jgi:hypothetical protein
MSKDRVQLRQVDRVDDAAHGKPDILQRVEVITGWKAAPGAVVFEVARGHDLSTAAVWMAPEAAPVDERSYPFSGCRESNQEHVHAGASGRRRSLQGGAGPNEAYACPLPKGCRSRSRW